MIPYLEKAINNNFGVIILNPTKNSYKSQKKQDEKNNQEFDNQEKPIKGSESPIKHTLYVWDNIINKCKGKFIFIIAYGNGAICAISLLQIKSM